MNTSENIPLQRSVTLWQLVFYGVGTILGAGIYVLINKIAGHSGMHAPLVFLGAGIVAAFSALSYAELSSRYPLSAGEAEYAHQAFGVPWLTIAVGFAVVLTGVVSSSAISSGAVGYINLFISLPSAVIITVIVVGLSAIAAWGIKQSIALAVVITVMEIGGIVLVIVVGAPHLADLPSRIHELLPSTDTAVWAGMATAIFLAFYAFIGFEDMVNLAEKVKQPERNMPRAIVITLAITTVLYVLVALVAVLSMPVAQLAASDAPFVDLVQANSSVPTAVIAVVSLVAVINGALVQIIMASRVLYGMARRGLVWQPWARVNPRTQTPIIATVTIGVIVLILAIWLPVEELARITSYIVLSIFTITNVALIVIQRRDPQGWHKQFPGFVPYIGAGLCIAMLSMQFF